MANSRRGKRDGEMEEVVVQEGASSIPLFSHWTQKGNVKREALRVVSTAQSSRHTEGAFVHHHLAPITARQNSFSAVGRRVNGPDVGCEERPCPHTPTRGQGLIGPL